jgi:hypothetical protein
LSGLPRNRKDGVMCKVGIIDYSVGGVFRAGQGSGGREGGGEEGEERKGRGRR